MKFLKVNMTDKTVTVEDVPQEYHGLGGRGLTSIMINAEFRRHVIRLGRKINSYLRPDC